MKTKSCVAQELNLSALTISREDIDKSTKIIPYLISLYKNFDEKKESFCLNLLIKNTKAFAKEELAFLPAVTPNDINKFVLAHWYIYGEVEYNLLENAKNKFNKLRPFLFFGDIATTYDDLSRAGITADVISADKIILEKTGIFWLDSNSELTTAEWDINLLDFEEDFSKKNKKIINLSKEINSRLLGVPSAHVNPVRRVLIVDTNGSIVCDVLRDNHEICVEITEANKSSETRNTFQTASEADAEVNRIVDTWIKKGYEVLNDI
jgi:hypothetical protein